MFSDEEVFQGEGESDSNVGSVSSSRYLNLIKTEPRWDPTPKCRQPNIKIQPGLHLILGGAQLKGSVRQNLTPPYTSTIPRIWNGV